MKETIIKIFRISFFILFIISADRIVGKILARSYQHSSDITISKVRYTFKETNEDILTFGSSRAQHHYVSDTISKITGYSVFNCGLGGQGIAFSFIQISETLKRYKPLILLLDVSPNILLDKNSDQKLKILGPYYHDDKLISTTLNKSSRFERLKYSLGIYPYNSMLYDLLLSFVYNPNVSIKGYIPITGTIDATMIEVDDARNIRDIPSKQVGYLKEIIKICKEEKAELWILISPIYKISPGDLNIINDLRILSKQYSIHFLDFSQDYNFSDYRLFKDNLHLNLYGASKYSKMVSDSLVPFLRQNR